MFLPIFSNAIGAIKLLNKLVGVFFDQMGFEDILVA
jgi:hypothetical protein